MGLFEQQNSAECKKQEQATIPVSERNDSFCIHNAVSSSQRLTSSPPNTASLTPKAFASLHRQGQYPRRTFYEPFRKSHPMPFVRLRPSLFEGFHHLYISSTFLRLLLPGRNAAFSSPSLLARVPFADLVFVTSQAVTARGRINCDPNLKKSTVGISRSTPANGYGTGLRTLTQTDRKSTRLNSSPV